MKKFQIISLAILLLFLSKGDSLAFGEASGSSAVLNSTIEDKTPYNSPLASYASDFVKSADKYNLDWRLVASIAGLESTFGKHVPASSYNGWGWGIYGNNVTRFNSWEDGIETISKGLRERYLGENPESNPYIIGPTYAASPSWAQRVTFFMNRMEAYRIRNAKSTLALAL